MPVSDELKTYRDKDYSKSNDPDEPNETPRIIKLSEEEVKSLVPYQIKPGEEVILEVSGNLEGDHFHVMSVKYAEEKGGDEGENDMSKEVVQRVMPTIQPSPSS